MLDEVIFWMVWLELRIKSYKASKTVFFILFQKVQKEVYFLVKAFTYTVLATEKPVFLVSASFFAKQAIGSNTIQIEIIGIVLKMSKFAQDKYLRS